MAEYQPGVCNIGRDHRRQRLALGAVSGVAAVAYTAWVVATGRPAVALVGTFVFAAGALLGAIQYRLKFCVSMAALARYDLSGTAEEVGTVAERSAVHTDRWRAAQILVVSVAGGGLLTLAVFVAAVA